MIARALVVVLIALASAGRLSAQQTHLLVVTGLAGEPRFTTSFRDWAGTIVDAAKTRYAVPAANIAYLAADPAVDAARITGRSTRENITAAVQAIAKRAQPGDQVLFVLIGHGSAEGDVAKFNLPGPDLTAFDYSRLLDLLKEQRVAFVNTASASGAFLEPLAGQNRIIATATKSAGEQNETMFARYLAAALKSDGADLDKDGRVSILEAFTYARTEVEREYGQQNRILTEHATLRGDSAFARTIALSARDQRVATRAAQDSTYGRLIEQRRQLETQVDALRARKASLDSLQYSRQLEALLLQLAAKNREIRRAEGEQ